MKSNLSRHNLRVVRILSQTATRHLAAKIAPITTASSSERPLVSQVTGSTASKVLSAESSFEGLTRDWKCEHEQVLLYKDTVVQLLHRLRFELRATQLGADFDGHWTLAQNGRMPVLLQCVYSERVVASRFRNLLELARDKDSLLVIASNRPYSEAVIRFFTESKQAICLFVISTRQHGGRMQQMSWNQAADRRLNGLRVHHIYDDEFQLKHMKVEYLGENIWC